MKRILTNDWAEHLDGEFEKSYYQALRTFLKEEYSRYKVYPKMEDIFNALHYTPYASTRVVVLGQDPYHGPGQAHGLSFSVGPGVARPPSLQNIFKELQADLGYPIPNHGSLTHWARQGILLLNTVLTVRQGEPNSHRGSGWETFTDAVIRALLSHPIPLVFLLWGSHAQSKKPHLEGTHHVFIESPHPSPLSAHRGFFGSRPFSRTNEILRRLGQAEVDWRIP